MAADNGEKELMIHTYWRQGDRERGGVDMKVEGRANKAAVKGEIKRAGKMRDKEWIFMSLITSFL